MENKEVENLTFDYDNLKILGVFDSRIFVKGLVDFEDDCVLIIDRSLFKKSMDIWLDTKKHICEAYNHFCGHGGSITANEYEELPKKERITILDEEKMKNMEPDQDYTKVVRTFKINSFEDWADMEHG